MRFTPPPFPTILLSMKKQITLLILLASALLLTSACGRNSNTPDPTVSTRLRDILLSSCHRNDIRTETFQIEQLRHPDAVPLIAKALSSLRGIQDVKANPDTQTLTIVFNGRALYLKNIEYEIVNAGFSLPNWPATPKQKAALPKIFR